MAMSRYGLTPLIIPHNQRIPTGSSGFAIPFHGSEAASPGFTPLDQVASGAGAPAANEWSADPFAYTFPIGNGGTPKCCWNSDPDLLDDSQMALDLLDMEVGSQVIVAMSLTQQAETPSANHYVLTYGNNQAGESFWGIGMSSSTRALLINWRTVSDGTSTANSLTDISGTSFTSAAFNNVKTWLAYSIHITGELTCQVNAAYSNGTQSGTAQNTIVTFAGSRPGRIGADHKGVVIGARWNGSSYTNHFGTSGTTACSVGSIYVRRWNDTDTDRNAAILADMLARPDECPSTMLI